ncbi:AMP-binding protein [Novosphingobium sp.]|uniref:AMP-binding protein n=1 Tax=Novosphingobium sp. TaxID=1874826 RepID=UPI0025ECD19A|nr:AMP-binding protein [Novosphingobium sp.]
MDRPLHPCHHAASRPDATAMVVADTGETLSYAELDAASNRFAQAMRAAGLRPGDRLGVMLRNGLLFAQVYWGAQRSGLMPVLLQAHLSADEAAWILDDCRAKALLVAGSLGPTPHALAADRGVIPDVTHLFAADDTPLPGSISLTEAMAAQPAEPVADEISGFHMLYSSGTTGRPKGVAMPFEPGPIDRIGTSEGSTRLYEAFDPLVSFNAGPLFHGAPLNAMLLTQRLGGTFVTLAKFDAEATLAAIERYKVNHAQFVPTMFVRLLALPKETRAKYDLSSLRFVLHAAAPCPVEIKRRMIEWLGPIVHEYYASTEGVGATFITAQEWLERPGSVGKSSLGPIHICDEAGAELPAGDAGQIWFEAPPGRFVRYLNDPAKTRAATHPEHVNWFTVGDIGRLDEGGYLYLTDRKDFMIISGGVNIYPQAVEDCLIVHPAVLDVAVIGVPHSDYGEQVLAIVQPKHADADRSGLEADLRAWCATRISPVTAPRLYRFVDDLPRLASGKLAKHALRAQFALLEGTDR